MGLQSHSVGNRALANRISEDTEVLRLLKLSADDPGIYHLNIQVFYVLYHIALLNEY